MRGVHFARYKWCEHGEVILEVGERRGVVP